MNTCGEFIWKGRRGVSVCGCRGPSRIECDDDRRAWATRTVVAAKWTLLVGAWALIVLRMFVFNFRDRFGEFGLLAVYFFDVLTRADAAYTRVCRVRPTVECTKPKAELPKEQTR